MVLGARTAAWSGGALPYDREVAWIEFDANSWINTNIVPSLTSVCSVKAMPSSSSPTTVTFFAADNLGFVVRRNSTTTIGYCGGAWWEVSSAVDFTSFHTYTLDGSVGVSVDGTVIINRPCDLSQSSKLLIGRRSSQPAHSGGMRYSSFSVDDSIDAIAVLKDGVPCFYNKVDGNFFYNAGTGSFTWEELST